MGQALSEAKPVPRRKAVASRWNSSLPAFRVSSRWVAVAPFTDPRTGTAIVAAALDNLVKGAAGQAIQNANLMLGLDEGAGLTADGLWP